MSDKRQIGSNAGGAPFERGKPISADKLNRIARAVDRANSVGGPGVLVGNGSQQTISLMRQPERIESFPFRVYEKRSEQHDVGDGVSFPVRYYWMEDGRFIGPYRVGLSAFNRSYDTEGNQVLTPLDSRLWQGLHTGRTVDVLTKDGSLKANVPSGGFAVLTDISEYSKDIPGNEWEVTEPTWHYWVIHLIVWNGVGTLPSYLTSKFGTSAAVINNPFVHCWRSPLGNPIDDAEYFAAMERPLTVENPNDPRHSKVFGHYLWIVASLDNRMHAGKLKNSLRSDISIWLPDVVNFPVPSVTTTPTPEPTPEPPPPVEPVPDTPPPPPPPDIPPPPPGPDVPPDVIPPPVKPPVTVPDTTDPAKPKDITPTKRKEPVVTPGPGTPTTPSGGGGAGATMTTYFLQASGNMTQNLWLVNPGALDPPGSQPFVYGTLRKLTWRSVVIAYEPDPPPATTVHPVYAWVQAANFPLLTAWFHASKVGDCGPANGPFDAAVGPEFLSSPTYKVYY